jgi:hypothetical protein
MSGATQNREHARLLTRYLYSWPWFNRRGFRCRTTLFCSDYVMVWPAAASVSARTKSRRTNTKV